jgi:hypothetical protein
MKDKHAGNSNESAQFDGDGDWSYLRAHLDNPRHQLARKLGSALAAWMFSNFQPSLARPVRLALIGRIPLGPRQSVALVEAEGMHLLVATSTDGAASFFPLTPSAHSRPSEPSVEPVLSADGCGIPADFTQNRIFPPRSSHAGRTAKRLGFSGRVSW